MSVALFIHQIVVLLFAGLLVWAAIVDVRKFIIPNRVVVSLMLLWPAHLVYAWDPATLGWSLLLAAAAFLVGAGLFAARLMGGGDVKLIAAVTLWAGPALVLPFFVVMTLAGGALALASFTPLKGYFYLTGIRAAASSSDGAELPPDQYRLPYAVAIALGGIFVAAHLLGA